MPYLGGVGRGGRTVQQACVCRHLPECQEAGNVGHVHVKGLKVFVHYLELLGEMGSRRQDITGQWEQRFLSNTGALSKKGIDSCKREYVHLWAACSGFNT